MHADRPDEAAEVLRLADAVITAGANLARTGGELRDAAAAVRAVLVAGPADAEFLPKARQTLQRLAAYHRRLAEAMRDAAGPTDRAGWFSDN